MSSICGDLIEKYLGFSQLANGIKPGISVEQGRVLMKKHLTGQFDPDVDLDTINSLIKNGCLVQSDNQLMLTQTGKQFASNQLRIAMAQGHAHS
jgi:hypothetical protein